MAKPISIKYFEESQYSRKPEQAMEKSAGYDLFAADAITICRKLPKLFHQIQDLLFQLNF